jgi:hypothetical protein
VSHREQLCKWIPEPVLLVLVLALVLAPLQQEQMAQVQGLLDHEECRFP